MQRRVKTALALAITTIPLLCGCEKSPRDKLQGRWLGETIENVPASQLQKATGWVRGTAIEFAGNKVTVTIPAETPRSGTFRVSRLEGDNLLVSFLREEGGRDDAEMRLVGDQTLRWRLGEGREIVLVRARN